MGFANLQNVIILVQYEKIGDRESCDLIVVKISFN
jgi:hypothetical protein